MKTALTLTHLTGARSMTEKISLRHYVDEKPKYFFFKRLFDLVFSVFVIVGLLTWMVPLVGLLILMETKGGIFFIQRRVGKGGKIFSCIKFRTMVFNSDANHMQAQPDDYRITRVGKFLRFTNLDEFPQFLNVFAGDMSIVGPRPHMITDCNQFSNVVSGYKFRNMVKPGITGLSQVKGLRGPAKDFATIFRRFEYDAFYVRNAGFGLDLRIIRQTTGQVAYALLRKRMAMPAPLMEIAEDKKLQLFTANYSVTDYIRASETIISKARINKSFGMSALAVHGLIETVRNKEFRDQVNSLNMVVPDGQPIRWALNSFYKAGLEDRVTGPILTKYVLARASEENLGVYLYGSTPETLAKFQAFININYPGVKISGIHPDRFREATPEEDLADIQKINESGANIVLVGRGCPRQEKWVASHLGKINAAMMAVGAAFDFHAGNISQAPMWMQQAGLEWSFRLIQEPGKLWKRYFTTNPHFIILFLLCKLRLRKVAFA
ncbi:MAG: WecB/TagA/CpsF family glycosyltransferase [Chitinophagaceae bacterium]|nr:WecB/TagA/CpsF family glycosyltransferase [Chitinophagaceae bacterium]